MAQFCHTIMSFYILTCNVHSVFCPITVLNKLNTSDQMKLLRMTTICPVPPTTYLTYLSFNPCITYAGINCPPTSRLFTSPTNVLSNVERISTLSWPWKEPWWLMLLLCLPLLQNTLLLPTMLPKWCRHCWISHYYFSTMLLETLFPKRM